MRLCVRGFWRMVLTGRLMPKKSRPAPMPGLLNLPFRAQPARLRPSRRFAPRQHHAARREVTARGPVDLPIAPQVGAGADQQRNDCGPACVRMALDYLGLAPGVSIDALSSQIDQADDGTLPQELVALAASHGASAFVMNLAPGQLPEPPVIALVRYSGFERDRVQDKRYWDLSAQNPALMHWAWWLGTVTIDGRLMSVWNDPLFAGRAGKAVLHPMDAFERAYVPYGASRVAIKFPAIVNPPPEGASPALRVTPAAAEGVNLRSSPEVRPDNLIRLLTAGTPVGVLEDAVSARAKMTSGQTAHWLAVRTLDGVDGYVAAWLMREIKQPPAHALTDRTALTRAAAVLHGTPGGAPLWSVADGAPLRVLDNNGPDWPTRIGAAGEWLEVESYAFKRGFVRADLLTLPPEADRRTAVADENLWFGDSAWLYGIHDDYGAQRGELFPNKRGWVLFTEDVSGNGATPIAAWAANPVAHGVLVRLNNGYNDGFRGPGTIPEPHGYDQFAQRCAAWVSRSMAGLPAQSTATFIIGNEMNNPREWPNPHGDPHTFNPRIPITPQGYADCFNRVYRAIKAVAPHARVVPGAVDPYNALYMDCLHYFTQMLAGIQQLDGFAFHTYTHGPEVSRIESLKTFDHDPLRWQYYDFRSYTTLMDHIPGKWRQLPVFITETDQTPTDANPQAWTGGRNGWVRAVYAELARWNAQPHAQQIQALILYRFARGGGSDALYCLQDKPEILAEFRDAVAGGDVRWRFAAPVAREAARRAEPRQSAKPVVKRRRRRKAIL